MGGVGDWGGCFRSIFYTDYLKQVMFFSKNWSLTTVQLYEGEQLPLTQEENMKSTF